MIAETWAERQESGGAARKIRASPQLTKALWISAVAAGPRRRQRIINASSNEGDV